MIRLDPKAAAWRKVDDEVVGLALEQSEYFTPNATATELWSLLAEGTTEEALAAHLVERFGIDSATAQDDVRTFVNALRDRGLLEG